VVDEAQRLTSECIEFLRYLHDHPHTRFALILVGGDGCWEVLSREPMLRARTFRRANFAPLSSEQVCALMGTFHPIYAGVDREVLLLVDDTSRTATCGTGASFTHRSPPVGPEHPVPRPAGSSWRPAPAGTEVPAGGSWGSPGGAPDGPL
jgi:hypothetical protein